jgi:predicted O-methyltransferase YrrM
VQGPIDFVFIDAWKPDYKKYLDMVYPKLAPGGLIIAHNVVNKRAEMLPFLQALEGKADLLTTIVSPSGEGVSVSWKRRSAEGRR